MLSPQEFKGVGNPVVLVPLGRDENELPDFAAMQRNFSQINALIRSGLVLASHTIGTGGLAAVLPRWPSAIVSGWLSASRLTPSALFSPEYGSIVLEMERNTNLDEAFGPV